MAQPATLSPLGEGVREKIIVALDVSSETEARSIVDELSGRVGGFKIGLQAFISLGPGFVRRLCDSGVRVFLDLKLHDIPNTVAMAAADCARLGVWMFNLHAIGGSEMLRRAVASVNEVCVAEGLARPLVIGVTVLTSSDVNTLNETGINDDVDRQVARLAVLSKQAGLDGVVASAREVQLIRSHVHGSFITVTPGIRPSNATMDDQKRVTTLRRAIADGSDYVVIGRPVTGAADRAKAVDAMIYEQ